MIRPTTTTAVFAVLGFVSLLAWSMIDARLCDRFSDLCNPPPGFCGGIDVCQSDPGMILGLAIIFAAPPIAFGIVGFILSRRGTTVRAGVASTFFVVIVHWLLMFLGLRVFHL